MTNAERQAAIVDLQKQFEDLHAEAYDKNIDLAQERGRQFEKLVHRVFKTWGLLVRESYHTGDNKSEQVDGVLLFEGKYALLEAKWEKANLAASVLFAFLGKVEGKFTGTIGVFVSRNELTSNFLTALDSLTGQMLWRANVGGLIVAGPMTYSVAGKQYVAVSAGRGLFVFAL